MGRGRGKGKKLTVTNHEDPASGEEEKSLAQMQSGRAEPPLKDEIKEEETGKVEAINEFAITTAGKLIKSPTSADTVKKRKRSSPVKEKLDLVNDENCNGTQTSIVEVKSNGFRHNGSRRKSKPRRAAEAVVECR